MASKIVVLDASAVLACLAEESGSGIVQERLENADCYISSVILGEIVARGSRVSVEHATRLAHLTKSMNITVVAFDEAQAIASGLLEPVTRKKGLSLGDRACLALAQQLEAAEVLTADKVWLELGLQLNIINIRG